MSRGLEPEAAAERAQEIYLDEDITMSIRFEPHEIPSVEQRGDDEWHCDMCGCTFDYEAFAIENGCPGCADIDRAQEGRRGAL